MLDEGNNLVPFGVRGRYSEGTISASDIRKNFLLPNSLDSLADRINASPKNKDQRQRVHQRQTARKREIAQTTTSAFMHANINIDIHPHTHAHPLAVSARDRQTDRQTERERERAAQSTVDKPIIRKTNRRLTWQNVCRRQKKRSGDRVQARERQRDSRQMLNKI